MVQGINEYDPNSSSYSPNYPTTTTNKVGHYVYFNAQGDASSAFLNCSNYLGGTTTGTGGFQFHQVSSTLQPTKLAHITTDGLQIPKDTRTTTYQTVGTFGSGANYFIMDINPSGPPTNWVRYNMYVVQVGNTTPTLSTGVNYNVRYVDTQVITFHTTTDPNSPIINSTGVLSILIPIGSTGQVNTAYLSATDLTFNSTSIISTLRNLQIKQTSVINQYISAAIYADGRPPITPSTTIAQQYAYTPSWYFKNTVVGYKINWYILANPGMIVSDILGLYIAFFNGTNTSNDNTPFVTVYTTPGTGTGPDYAPGFYHSSNTYVFDGSIIANTRYTEFLNLNNCPTPNYYGTTLRSMIQSTVSPNPRGTYAPTESVAFFSIGSNSGASVNSLEFAISKFGIMLSSGTTEVNFFA